MLSVKIGSTAHRSILTTTKTSLILSTFTVRNAPADITPAHIDWSHERALPGHHCPEKVPAFSRHLVARPHDERGGDASSMREVSVKSCQTDAGNRPKRKQPQSAPSC